MEVFIVEVIAEASVGKVSQEGYDTLEKAQAFVESRSHNPKQLSPYIYKDDEYTEYIIWRVKIK